MAKRFKRLLRAATGGGAAVHSSVTGAPPPPVADPLSQALRPAQEAAGYALASYQTLGSFAERSLLLQGRMACRQLPVRQPVADLAAVEFRVFSQWGEDGIVEWLVAHVPVPNHRFVEFGVENFREANCRFLMMNRNWRGLVMDGSDAHMAFVRSEACYWMYDVTAKAAFVTADNIDALITEAGFAGPLGILSIDIDGNDYWIWERIGSVDPAIVICEYNPILGDRYPIVVPYADDFTRFASHHSGLHFGASIAALRHLAERKGYTFVGTNSNGINAFFVRSDLAGSVLPYLVETRAYASRHRDSRDENGQLSFAGGPDRLALIADRPVVDVTTGATLRLGDLETPYSDAWLADMS